MSGGLNLFLCLNLAHVRWNVRKGRRGFSNARCAKAATPQLPHTLPSTAIAAEPTHGGKPQCAASHSGCENPSDALPAAFIASPLSSHFVRDAVSSLISVERAGLRRKKRLHRRPPFQCGEKKWASATTCHSAGPVQDRLRAIPPREGKRLALFSLASCSAMKGNDIFRFRAAQSILQVASRSAE